MELPHSSSRKKKSPLPLSWVWSDVWSVTYTITSVNNVTVYDWTHPRAHKYHCNKVRHCSQTKRWCDVLGVLCVCLCRQNNETKAETSLQISNYSACVSWKVQVYFPFWLIYSSFCSSFSLEPPNSFSHLPSCGPSWPSFSNSSHKSSWLFKSISSSALPHSSLLLLLFFHLPSSVKWESNGMTLRAERTRAIGLSQENDLNRPVHPQITNPPPLLHLCTPESQPLTHLPRSINLKTLQSHRGHGLLRYWWQSFQPSRQLDGLLV